MLYIHTLFYHYIKFWLFGNIEETGGKTIKLPYQEYLQSQKKHAKNGWYLRIDNNGWRPVKFFIYLFTYLFDNC